MPIPKPKIEKLIFETLEKSLKLTIYEIYDLVESFFGKEFDDEDLKPAIPGRGTGTAGGGPEWKHSIRNVLQNLKTRKNKYLKKALIVHQRKGSVYYLYSKPNYDVFEVMIVLDLYNRRGRPKTLDDLDYDVIEVSQLLRLLGKNRYKFIHHDYRNANSVSSKIGNLKANDENATSSRRNDKTSKFIWSKFYEKEELLSKYVKIIKEHINN